MKIIGIDNYDRDYVSDILIAENVREGYGELLVQFLNIRDDDRFYRTVSDDYKLYEYEY